MYFPRDCPLDTFVHAFPLWWAAVVSFTKEWVKTVYWLILLSQFVSPVHPLNASGAQGCERGWMIEAIIPFMTWHAPVEHV